MRRETGQASGEYAIVIFMIAIVCIAAVLLFGFALSGQYQSDGDQIQPGPGPLSPPTYGTASPTSDDDCRNNGWQKYPDFESEQECLDFVASLGP
jgi:hypothetical protein